MTTAKRADRALQILASAVCAFYEKWGVDAAERLGPALCAAIERFPRIEPLAGLVDLSLALAAFNDRWGAEARARLGPGLSDALTEFFAAMVEYTRPLENQ